MKIIHDKQAMRVWAIAEKAKGRSIGFVPTMGALHEGHASLVRAAVERDDVTVASVFVNPTQFAPHEDLDSYPRTFEEDCALLEKLGVDIVYAPDAETMYPEGYATYVTVEGLSEGLCSLTRPHFFRGVATVVTKLFCTVLPDRAYFGQKDAQQCAIIKRMAEDLDLAVEIVEMPIIRETDGLAMSSRNRYLSAEERQKALNISAALRRAQAMLAAGERDGAAIVNAVREGMAPLDIDYVVLVDARTMVPVDRICGEVLLAVAANMGSARLIDNIKFAVPQDNEAALEMTAKENVPCC
ncbi:MAG: pantoate--beta-alanine ligase [Candidatus Hydrogenedentes bacterium]|nr:pantoate--beta-alanine ligase [Candidatus Hydrogenedentota bacterium]